MVNINGIFNSVKEELLIYFDKVDDDLVKIITYNITEFPQKVYNNYIRITDEEIYESYNETIVNESSLEEMRIITKKITDNQILITVLYKLNDGECTIKQYLTDGENVYTI